MKDKEVSDNEDYYDGTLPMQVADSMAAQRSQRQRNQVAGQGKDVAETTKKLANFNFH